MRTSYLAAALCSLLGLGVAFINSGHYKFNDPIPVRVSNVAPFHNPTEKYPYDLLPWPCKPKDVHQDNPNLGAIINGERNRESLYQIHFQRSTNKQTVCGEKELNAGHIQVQCINIHTLFPSVDCDGHSDPAHVLSMNVPKNRNSLMRSMTSINMKCGWTTSPCLGEWALLSQTR